jgi:hypothetical protein
LLRRAAVKTLITDRRDSFIFFAIVTILAKALPSFCAGRFKASKQKINNVVMSQSNESNSVKPIYRSENYMIVGDAFRSTIMNRTTVGRQHVACDTSEEG